jgi:hypothetical protein
MGKVQRIVSEFWLRKAPVRSRSKHTLPGHLIISLTSYPPRFPSLDLAIRCLLDQSARPDLIVLWLTSEDALHVPASVARLQSDLFQIRTVETDARSLNKLVPALAAFPDSFIVTADDDIHYPRDWLSGLIDANRRYPNQILCRRAHRIRVVDGRILPYRQWDRDIAAEESHPALFPTGVGGVLYPPHAMPPETMDVQTFLRLCPTGDDIWIYFAATRAGRLFRRVGPHPRLRFWLHSEAAGLYHANVLQHGNDKQIAAMVSEFGLPRWAKAAPEHRVLA